jgi:NADPH-dependent glutamate synthase beta subunit-like oxidoreductase/NAD-dependent dihydropyrimidine dehydrogenase PreA subunit
MAEQLRECIVDLARLIRGSKKLTITKDMPDYYVLVDLVTDEMAEVLLGMKKRRTYLKPSQVAKNIGKSTEYCSKVLETCLDVGVVESRKVDGSYEYNIPIYVPGIFEIMVLNKKQAESHPEIAKAFEEYTRTTIAPMVDKVPLGRGALRVIPVESAISGENRKANYEEISYWLNKYDGQIAVGACQCRRSRRIMGEGCGDLEDEKCIILGDLADAGVRTNKLRRVTKEEASEIILKAEKEGCVHQVTNMDGKDKIFAICNCNINVCFALRTSQYFNAPNMSKSNYVAEVNPENCVACGACVEKCPSNAIRLGEKLCTKTPINVAKMELPDDHRWSKERYNPDFRNNRKLVVPETGTAPCITECPAHLAIQGYIRFASQGKYREALEVIKRVNPLPAVCGRICPHNCEDACTRNFIDSPVAIDDIKRFIADKDMEAESRFVPEKMHAYGKKIAIIGSGPAGISCAYYLAIDGYKVTVFEKQEKLGGMLTLGIPAFRLEKDVIASEIDVLRELDVEFKTGIEVGKDVTIPELRKEGFEGFYLAIGAQGGRKLGLEGEDAKGVITGVDFLRNVALDNADKLNGNIVVIGGGNVAIDVARTATRTGGKTVNMYCLESRKEMPALDEEIEEAESENIKINNGYGPNKIVVENGKVTGVEFKKCLSVFNDEGRFSPKYDDKDIITVPADHVLLSVGQSIEWGNLIDGTDVELNRNKTVAADGFTYATDEPDIFVGGDCFTGPKFAINAIASGKQGAISLHRSVWEGQSLTIGRPYNGFAEIDKDNLDLKDYDTTKRQRPLHIKENDGTFKDTRATLTEEQLKKETARCLGCGVAVVDEGKCLGCGVCTVMCKFDAVSIRKINNVGQAAYEDMPKEVLKNMPKREIKIAIRKVKDKFNK